MTYLRNSPRTWKKYEAKVMKDKGSVTTMALKFPSA